MTVCIGTVATVDIRGGQLLEVLLVVMSGEVRETEELEAAWKHIVHLISCVQKTCISLYHKKK